MGLPQNAGHCTLLVSVRKTPYQGLYLRVEFSCLQVEAICNAQEDRNEDDLIGAYQHFEYTLGLR